MKNFKPFYFFNSSQIKLNQAGMNLVEASISVTLLALFFITYAGFVEVSSRFNNKEQTNSNNSNGLLIDHHYLYISLDKYADILSQPGITLTDINNIKQKKSGELPPGCSFSPGIEWELPISEKPISALNWKPSNAGYAICLKSSSIVESSLTDLVSKSKGISSNAQPGIYFLLALPDEVSIDALPVRKLFCRPHPYC